MLNVPESVKALFKTDGVWKNFRAHFPGGELPDITNDDIVKESVRFTESVCSQDVFRFGLAEASVIEFETVGVANMYGMTMECSTEIDLSSLSAAQIAEIQAGTWDGEYLDAAASGLGVPVFRIPYGTFRVESCPRDHQAMAHRRVTGYTDMITDASPFESAKDALLLPTVNEYTPNIEALAVSQVARTRPQTLLTNGYTAQTLQMYETPVQSGLRPGDPYILGLLWNDTVVVKDSQGEDFKLYLRCSGQSDMRYLAGSATPPTSHIDKYELFTVDYNGQDYEAGEIYQSAVDMLAEMDIDAEQSGYSSLMDLVKAIFPPFRPFIGYGSVPHQQADMYNWPGILVVPDKEVIYPYRNCISLSSARTGDASAAFYWITAATITPERSPVGSSWGGSLSGFSTVPPTITMYTPQSPLDISGVKFQSTLTNKKTFTSVGDASVYKKLNVFSFTDAFSVVDLVNGWLELTGHFASAARSGGMSILRLSNTSPVSIAPGEYSNMWFDEYDVQPIGTVRYAYTDEAAEEQVVDYKFGDGKSVYDMTDNVVLASMANADPDTIQALLNQIFIPNLGAVSFVPVDLEAQGLPYLEAGDALAVTAQDGTICRTYALRRELDGVQVLTDQIDSQSGLIIDSEGGD